MDPADREKYGLPPQEKHQQANVRHVLYNEKLGVFLGLNQDGLLQWSKKDKPSENALAPTFLGWKDLKEFLGQKWDDMPQDSGLREVWPSASGNLATADDVRNGNIPSWA